MAAAAVGLRIAVRIGDFSGRPVLAGVLTGVVTGGLLGFVRFDFLVVHPMTAGDLQFVVPLEVLAATVAGLSTVAYLRQDGRLVRRRRPGRGA